MIARVHSSILQGIDAIGCEIEADVVESGDNESNIRLVGLAEAAVRESVSRTMSALCTTADTAGRGPRSPSTSRPPTSRRTQPGTTFRSPSHA